MGLSVVVGYAILAMASLVWFTSAWDAYESSTDEVEASRLARLEMDRQILGTDFEITGTSHVPVASILAVDATNTGAETIDASQMTLLVDGVAIDASRITYEVEGTTHSHWTPGTELQATVLLVILPPERVLLVDAHGVQALEVL